MHPSPTPIEKLTYEQALKELEAITDELENDSPALEKSMQLFERGQALTQRCAELLESAELRVQQLTGQESPQTELQDEDEA